MFVIFALPRSRTAWLSTFLTHKGWTCHHDLVAKCADMMEIETALRMPRVGLADTGAAHGWRVIRAAFPAAQFITVRRHLDNVKESLAGQGIDPSWADLHRLNHKLDEIEAQAGTIRLEYGNLSREDAMRTLVERTGQEFDRERWLMMRSLNIQIDMPQRLAILAMNRERLSALKQAVA
jgi:hypothetical protein